jgi:peptidoglycan/LPS O-acetylase OafA/YrhL
LAAIFVWHRALWLYDWIVQTAGYTLLCGLFGALILIGIASPAGSAPRRLFENRWLGSVGRYAYALYLFHYPVQEAIRLAGLHPNAMPTVFGLTLPGQLVFNVIVTGASLAAAFLSWHLFEKHFLRLKDRLAPSAPKLTNFLPQAVA